MLAFGICIFNYCHNDIGSGLEGGCWKLSLGCMFYLQESKYHVARECEFFVKQGEGFEGSICGQLMQIYDAISGP